MVSAMLIKIGKYLMNKVLNDVKIPKESVIELLDRVDKDQDGNISASEIVDALIEYGKALK